MRDFAGTPAVLGSGFATALVLRLARCHPAVARDERGLWDTP